MKKTALITSLFVVAAAVAPAVSATKLEDWSENNNRTLFEAIDSNGNGELTRQEVYVYIQVRNLFPRLDANDDGVLSNVEFGKFEPTMLTITQADGRN